MIDSTVILDFLFKLLNLGILIWLGFYVFQRYVLKTVKEEIKQRNSQEVALHKEFNDLGSLYDEHQRSLEEQEKLCHQLQQKVSLWNSIFEDQKKLQQKKLADLLLMVEKQRELQQQFLSREQTIKIIMPQAIQETRDELITYFSSERHAQKFMGKLIDFMER